MSVLNRSSGFTIIELMLTLLVVGMLAVLAMPMFDRTIQESRIVSQTNELTSHLGFARSEAAKRPNATITLCPSNDNTSCIATNNWEGGWIAMLDMDGDETLDAGDGDAVLKVFGAMSGGNSLQAQSGGGNVDSFQFSGNGQPLASGTFVVCDGRGAGEARAVVVMISGQTRLATDENGDGIVNLHGGGANVTCP
ncbi:GspH/FimT family pseudopilin [Marinobacter sp. SS21]|uniref:GspH/FimT family pseudopilin n=1 Tax=Marinobacter sp. SS21 TaxID=2979460 RepID=UPI00232D67D6|nr:GspH/FimT family pseudopilin [Marinobacter sp. SS21]MDC0663031.1 GspH/FimT family pseudopilin [Marinobacter sp. SS21]